MTTENDILIERAVAYYVAQRRQLGTRTAMRHTMQRFGVEAHQVRAALEAQGLLLRYRADNAERELAVLNAGLKAWN